MSVELFPHNQEAYDAVCIMLEEQNKACVIHPTGTGKSFIGFRYAEDHKSSQILWLAPSTYIYETQMENWLKAGGDELENISFMTYKKLSLLQDEEIAGLAPDLILADEMHRAGAPYWQGNFRRLLSLQPDAKLLGLTATKIRYLDNQRDMADELFDNMIASEMTLGEAIVRGILPAPKYVTTLYGWQKELGYYEERVSRAQSKATRDAAEELIQALRRALEMADGLDDVFAKHMEDKHGKYLVFTPNIEILRECMEKTQEWFGKVDPNPHVYYLYSLESASTASFQKFKNDNDRDHLRLLYTIDALNEGIHVEEVSGVILFRPTISPIVYKQQIGRALSSSSTQVPVIFDVVNNFENLYSIGMIEEEMQAAITYYSYSGEENQIVTERFRIIDELREARKLFDEIEGVLSAPWEQMYECARKYHEEYGDLLVHRSYKSPEGYPLGRWLNTQRAVRKGLAEGILDEERIQKLDALGMRWDSVNDISWERHYQACKEYKEKNGNLDIPSDYITDGMKLGVWLGNARKAKRYNIKSKYFSPERLDMLSDLGIVWEYQNDVIWERNYEAAKAWKEEYGDLEVPNRAIYHGVKLGSWLGDLRKVRRGIGKKRLDLTQEQIERLDAIGMRWDNSWDLAWEKGFSELQEYRNHFGSCEVPCGYLSEEGYKLGVWCTKQRENYKKPGKLTEERIRRLEELGFSWSQSRANDWDECYEAVKAYYLREGTLNMPQDYKAGRVWLNKWLNEQRQIMLGNRKGRVLTEEQMKKLNAIGFTGKTAAEQRWEDNYNQLKSGQKSKTLTNWVSNQKQMYRNGTMPPDRVAKFRELGIIEKN